MNISRVMKYLMSGIVIGAVLFFAAFGVMNLISKSPDTIIQKPGAQAPSTPVTSSEVTTAAEVATPAIEVNSTRPTAQNGQGTSDSPIKIKPLGSGNTAAQNGEMAQEVIPPQTAAFGTLTLSTVNSLNNQPTAANFMIENSDGVAIALVKDTASSTLSLPAGDYKITVTQGQSKLVRFLGVKEGQNGAEVFELEVPVLAGETAQTPVAGTLTPINAQQAPVADQANQTETTQSQETPAENASDIASEDPAADGVDRPATEASDEVTVAATNTSSGSKAMGGLRVSALTKVGNRPTNASFYIQKLNGENVENVKGVSTQQFNLPEGKYRVTARKGTARVVTEITVVANRGLHEVFHIPEAPASSTPASTSSTTAQVSPATPTNTQTTRPAVVSTQPPPATQSEAKAEKTGRLELFSQTASNNKSIKSNFYVQTTAGKLVANKTYVDSIGYKLPVGKYKVTVRSTGYEDKTTELFVREGQVRREVFKMQVKNRAPSPAQTRPATPAQQAPIPASPVSQNETARRGGLQVNIVSAETGQGLIADISVHRLRGREIRRLNQTTSARFNLPARDFILRVKYGGLVTNQNVKIRAGKLAIKTITFKQANE